MAERVRVAGTGDEVIAPAPGLDPADIRAHLAMIERIRSALRAHGDKLLFLVIGGFNSSNTNHLVEIASASTRTYHIEDAANLVSERWIRHKPLGEQSPLVEEGWLPAGPLTIGVTAGASTPDSEIGASIERLLRFRGMPEEVLAEAATEGRRIAEDRRRRELERMRSKRDSSDLTPPS